MAGEWAELWRETVRVSYVVQESRPLLESAEKRRVQRVNALWEEGELARVAAAALPSRDPLRSDDVLEKLRDLFPPRPDGDHMPAPNPANGLTVDVRARAFLPRSRRSSVRYRVAPALVLPARASSIG